MVVPVLTIDVVVVNFNGGDYLTRCVQSVLASEHPVNLIVVDNCSSDGSAQQIEAESIGIHTLRVVHNEVNVGFSRAVNQAAKLSNGEYILLLNPDCELYPHTVHDLANELSGHDEAGALGALVFNEDGSEQRGCRRLEPTFTRSVVTALRLDKHFTSVNLQHSKLPSTTQAIDAVSGSALMTRRSTFEALNGLDEGYFLHVEDLDYCRRVREYGQNVLFTPHISLFHCQGVSTQAVPYRMEWYKTQGMLRYHEKYQKPNQNWLRSSCSRAIVYLNYVLSITRHRLRGTSNTSGKSNPVSMVAMRDKKLIITGANSDLGSQVLHDLQEPTLPVIAVTRRRVPKHSINNEIWLNWGYFEKVPSKDLGPVTQWLSLSPIWAAQVIGQVISRHGPPKRIVAISSTSVSGKKSSADAQEQQVVKALIDGEKALMQWSDEIEASTTIGRASMVYGGASNKNIKLIETLIRWFRFFPIIGQGEANRQPVHIADLSKAIEQIRENTVLPSPIYNLAGGEVISYRTMVERIFETRGQRQYIVTLPVVSMRLLAKVVCRFPGLGFVNEALVERISDDMTYSIASAKQDFNYSPGHFRP